MKAEAEGLEELPDEVLNFIASNISDNVRQLEGALIRVAAYSSLNRLPLSEEVARQVLIDLLPPVVPRVITPELILDETAKMFGFTVEDLCGRSRRRPLVIARQIGMYVFRELTDFSYPKIAEEFGGRDHTTVIHAVEKIKGLMTERHNVFDQVNELMGRIRLGRAPVDKPVDSWGYLAADGGELHPSVIRPVTVPGDAGGQPLDNEIALPPGRNHGCPQSTGPTTATTRTPIVFVRRWTVKFRCERDTLAEAIGTAQRAVSARSGALPVLSGIQVTAAGDHIELVGSRSRSHDPGAGPGPGRHRGPGRGAGQAVRRADHAAQGRRRDVRGRGRRRPDRRGLRQGERAAAAGRRVPAGRRARPAPRSPSTPVRSRRRCAR